MRLSADGFDLWCDTGDAPAPRGPVARGEPIAAVVGLRPPHAAAAVVLSVRINGGAARILRAEPHRATAEAMFFRATFTGLAAGDRVEYSPIARIAAVRVPAAGTASPAPLTFVIATNRAERPLRAPHAPGPAPAAPAPLGVGAPGRAAPPLPELRYGVGWTRDLPDARDFSVAHEAARGLVHASGIARALASASLPARVDLREAYVFPAIETQGNINSCTAHATTALMEFLQQRYVGRYDELSRMFVYKNTRELMQVSGNVPVTMRSTLRAIRIFGAPPEQYWPYTESQLDEAPPAFAYSFGQEYRTFTYIRLDPASDGLTEALRTIRAALAAGFPALIGFSAYASTFGDEAKETGEIPYPASDDHGPPRRGDTGPLGHAVLVSGYDDGKLIRTSNSRESDRGALLVRNSWGADWGDGGYGWLPYRYVTTGLASDAWTIVDQRWFQPGDDDA